MARRAKGTKRHGGLWRNQAQANVPLSFASDAPRWPVVPILVAKGGCLSQAETSATWLSWWTRNPGARKGLPLAGTLPKYVQHDKGKEMKH